MNKAKPSIKKLSPEQLSALLQTLQIRFEKNGHRHKGMEWVTVLAKLNKASDKLWSLHEMERTGGEPDVTAYDKKTGELIFTDCAAESPK